MSDSLIYKWKDSCLRICINIILIIASNYTIVVIATKECELIIFAINEFEFNY